MSSSYNAKKTLEYDLIPPHSDDLERTILGCMISNRDCLSSGLAVLKEEDFYNPDNLSAFNAIKKANEDGIEVDGVIIANRLEGVMDEPKIFVANLLESVTTTSNFKSQVKTLKDLTLKRNVRNANHQIENLIGENRFFGDEFGSEVLRIISEAISSDDDLLGDNFAFRPHNIKDLSNSAERHSDWLWEGFIKKGSLILLAGAPKVGKSTLAYHMAINMANGNKFLNADTVKTSILLLALEERKGDVEERLRLLEAGDNIFWHCGLLSIAQLGEIKRFMEQNNIGLILVDPLDKIWNVDDENDAAKIARAIIPFIRLAHDTNTAVFLIHHLRKTPGSDGMDIRGSTALFASVDNAIILKRYGEGNERLLETIGRWDCFSEVISLNGNGYERLGSKSEVKQSAQKRMILDCLNDTPLSAKQISELTGLSGGISTILKRLYDDGDINRTGSGKKNDPFLYANA